MHGEYSYGMNCSWSIFSNLSLELSFTRFQTERGYDPVTVYDGSSSSSPLIGRYDGDLLPQRISSSSHELFFDSSVSRSGFVANYHSKGFLIGN